MGAKLQARQTAWRSSRLGLALAAQQPASQYSASASADQRQQTYREADNGL